MCLDASILLNVLEPIQLTAPTHLQWLRCYPKLSPEIVTLKKKKGSDRDNPHCLVRCDLLQEDDCRELSASGKEGDCPPGSYLQSHDRFIRF